MHGFVLFLSTSLNTLSSNHGTGKILITHNHSRHCRVRFSSFVRQPFSKQLYTENLTAKLKIQIKIPPFPGLA